MRLLTYERPGRGDRLAALVDGRVHDLNDLDATLPTHATTFLAMGDDALERARDALEEMGPGQDPEMLEFRPPVQPGRYLDFYSFEQHVATSRAKRGLKVVPEWYEVPVYYNGNHRAMLGHKEPVRFPAREKRRDFELELAAVVGTKVRDLSAEKAESHIAGYTILNDWSARDLQVHFMKVGLGPAKGKDFANSLGPVLVIPDSDDRLDPRDLRMRAFVNDECWTDNNSGTGHYTFGQMLAYAAEGVTLLPGDVLGSGTVGGGCGFELDRYLSPGDEVRLEVDGIGALVSTVVE